MVDLSTTYLGIKLKNPLVVSASPLSGDLANLQKMEQAGAAAVVLPSLFEEQVRIADMRLSPYVPDQHGTLPETLKHIPEMAGYNQGVNGYIVHLYEAKKALSIPVIASLNAYQQGGWARFARILESAGADALELNVYYLAAKPQVTGTEIEQMYINLVQEVKAQVKTIPVAIKLSPFFSAMANMAQRLDAAGADGLVLFNRFYQPDFDLETETLIPSLEFSTPAELRLRLRWVALLYNHIQADLAITGGVHSAADVIKSILVGASAVMMTSALYKNGIAYLQTVVTNLHQWLEAHDYSSIRELRGHMSQQTVTDPAAFARANYMNVLQSRADA